ncbi:YtzH-like family protein [Bacillus methanolicus]|uniref:YtzH-like protein n=1 Tax=Bacillus methanolicus (strain MGA3 / ATCC 53907) TaxID=796606 RepID=I3ECD3_BACMM|nr:YtzH-like family protein [Bacillus methanolicus]AIE61070.1 hypothetical protein BMMGA3_13400 [Bacillus methanolicus MGA3]EIJ84154.1 hypothetical protein MGA3_02665 [Bacillus methanolicus MGA3]
MPITHQDQLNLLTDILSNHQVDCCGSVSECEQLERLVKSLMVNTNINENVKNILQEIYQYSQHGIQSSDLDRHIKSNQERLSEWINNMNHFS